METVLAQTLAENLLPARLQMAFTLGSHIILACFGVGFPVLLLAAEWRFLKTGDELWRTLAKRWSKAFAVLFAVGAVSGTVLSFELGLLWPNFMGRWGGVIGLPFTMEGFAFFLEAIFAGIYLYGWDRLPSRVHWWTGWPIAISGCLSALFVVTANSWMNTPVGFDIEAGKIVNVDPIAAIFNEAAGAQTLHMIVAAYLVSGFGVAAFYALRRLRGSELEYDRRAMILGLWMALPLVPVQMAVGDWSAKVVAKSQPTKLAAMESHFETQTRAPLRIGGIPDVANKETRFAIEIPGGLSFIAYGDFEAEVKGLNDIPPENHPPVAVVHFAFQTMVGIGSIMMFASLWAGLSYWKSRAWPTSQWFLYLIVALGPLSIVALEAGWVVTEVGRQPWIVQGYMKTAEAVTLAPGIWQVFAGTMAIYAFIGMATIVVLRQIANAPMPEESSSEEVIAKEETHGAG